MTKKQVMSWDTFWQAFNMYFNRKAFGAVLELLETFYNPEWNFGLDLVYNPELKKHVVKL